MLQEHFAKSARIQCGTSMRAVTAMQDSGALIARGPHAEVYAEAFALFVSASRRSIAMQKSWGHDWMEWAMFASTLPGADTMSKLVALQSNIVLQAQAQLSAQMTEALELAENVEVGYSYWLSQQLQKQDAS